MTRRAFIFASLTLVGCPDEPKQPVPCTGTEQWPDPCAPGAITETATDASVSIPMQPDPPTRKR